MIRKFGGVTGLTNQPQGLDVGLGGGSNIKSLQTGSATIPGSSTSITATITAVDLSKAIVLLNFTNPGGTNTGDLQVYSTAELTNATTITLTRQGSSASATVSCRWTVIEFNNVKSLQRGATVLDAVVSATATVTSVNTGKCMLFATFTTTFAPNSSPNLLYEITNATTLTFTQESAAFIKSIKWQLIEFS